MGLGCRLRQEPFFAASLRQASFVGLARSAAPRHGYLLEGSIALNVIDHAPAELYLDAANPRLADEGFSTDDQNEILQWLWRNKSVNELVDSIRANGFWKHEELFATEEGGRLVVVEGNRRLAAVKVLSEPDLRKALGIHLAHTPSEDVLESIRTLPVIHATRQDLWGFVGFKHVNGAQAWDSIAKAEYVFRVRRDFGLSLGAIASGIGDRHETVSRLYRGYVVLRQAQDEFGFDTADTRHRRFPFSHLWTALGYVSIRKYLGVDPATLENENPVSNDHLPQLRNLMRWLYGSESENVAAKVRRQNPDLRNLARALEVQKGRVLLEAGSLLSVALNASLGDARLFRTALTSAESSAKEAMQFVSTGFGGEQDLLETGDNLLRLAQSLKRVMTNDERES